VLKNNLTLSMDKTLGIFLKNEQSSLIKLVLLDELVIRVSIGYQLFKIGMKIENVSGVGGFQRGDKYCILK
jgi:hypothetical protein